jgi:hypothetical protein
VIHGLPRTCLMRKVHGFVALGSVRPSTPRFLARNEAACCLLAYCTGTIGTIVTYAGFTTSSRGYMMHVLELHKAGRSGATMLFTYAKHEIRGYIAASLSSITDRPVFGGGKSTMHVRTSGTRYKNLLEM